MEDEDNDFISTQEVLKLQRTIKAFGAVECSALKKTNLDDVFIEAIRAVEEKNQKSEGCKCVIL